MFFVCYLNLFSRRIQHLHNLKMDSEKRPSKVRMETSLGAFEVELYWNEAPKTCRNFAELSRRGYYDGTKFHRIIPDFMIQGGDPTATGRGGQSIYGPTFEDEITGTLKHTGAGILSMANAGPNTNGSQFFITLAPCQHLDNKHTIFGRVCSNLECIQKLGRVPTDKNDRPTQNVVIKKANIIIDGDDNGKTMNELYQI